MVGEKTSWLAKVWQLLSSRALTLYLLGMFGFYYLIVVILTGYEVATLAMGIDVWASRGGDIPGWLATSIYPKIFFLIFILNLIARLTRGIFERNLRFSQEFLESLTSDIVFQQSLYTVMNFPRKKLAEAKAEAVSNLIKSRGFKVNLIKEKEGFRLYAARGGARFWVKFLFKLGLLLFLFGFALSMMTRAGGGIAVGEQQVIESQQIKPQPIRYSWRLEKEKSEGASLTSFPWAYLTVSQVDPSLKSNFLPEGSGLIFSHNFRAEIITATRSFQERPVIVRLYPPVPFYGHYLFLYEFGIGPEIRVQTLSGEDIRRGSFFLNIFPIGKEDFFQFSGLSYTFSLKILKGTVFRGRERLVSTDVRNPIYQLKIFEGRKKVFDQPVKSQEIIRFRDYLISIPQTRFWIRLGIIRDWGLPIAFLGAILFLVGFFLWLLFIFFWVQEELFLIFTLGERYNRLYFGLKTEKLKLWSAAKRFQELTWGLDEILGSKDEKS